MVATVERPLLLAFWAVVLWGTLLIAVFGVRVASAGLADADREPVARTPTALAYANLARGRPGGLVWLTVAVLALRDRRARP